MVVFCNGVDSVVIGYEIVFGVFGCVGCFVKYVVGIGIVFSLKGFSVFYGFGNGFV